MLEHRMIGWKHWAAAVVLGISVILVLASAGVDPHGRIDHDASSNVITSMAGIDGGDVDHQAHSHSNPGTTCQSGGHCSPVALFVASAAGQARAAAGSRHRLASHRVGSRLIDPDLKPPIA